MSDHDKILQQGDEDNLLATAIIEMVNPRFRSQVEQAWDLFGDKLLQDDLGIKPLMRIYEAMSFNIAGRRYTPDFIHILENGWIVVVECKGSRHMKSYRDSRLRWNICSELYSFFVWAWADQDKNGIWTIEYKNIPERSE